MVKVFGAMEYCSGRLCSQDIAGRLTADSYQACLRMLLAHTQEPLMLSHDGARYHTRQATQPFFETHRARITADPLPAYAPDDNPIASLWKQTMKRATHNQYFKN
jgi:transposase